MGKIKELFEKFTKLKHSGLLLAALVIGILLILVPFEGSNSFDSKVTPEENIRELCERICKSDIYVTVSTNSLGDISGVALVLTDGDTPGVKLKLTEAVSTLYSLPSSKIYVTAPIK